MIRKSGNRFSEKIMRKKESMTDENESGGDVEADCDEG
jgi:hypothetical protein